MKRDNIHNWYSKNDDGEVEIHEKPRWVIINEAYAAIDRLRNPKRFIEISGNSLDFARL